MRPLDLALGGLLLAAAAAPPTARWAQLLAYAALWAALGGTGLRLGRWLLGGESGLSVAVAASAATVALAVVPATLLGHLGWLSPPALLIWAACAWVASRFVPPAAAAPPARPAPARPNVETTLLAAATAGLCLLTAAYLVRARYLPPGASSFDDLYYHLSAVASWLETGDLRMLKFSFGDSGTTFYPIIGQLFSWALVAPFRDSDFAARFSQLPFALLSVVAVAAIARRLGTSAGSAAVAALLYGTIPRFLPDLALTAGNDHTAGFFALAAVDAALLVGDRPSGRRAAYAGLTLGLLAGTKYIGLLFAAPLLALLGVALAGRVGWRRAGLLAGPWAVAALVAGGYTYLRNFAATGNPIFPQPLTLLGTSLFPGWEGASVLARRVTEGAFDPARFLWQRGDLFGPLFRFTLLPAALLAPAAAVVRLARGQAGRREEALVLALPALFFAAFVVLIHDHRDSRYLAAAVALAAVGVGWLVERLPARPAALARGALAALALYQLVIRPLGAGIGLALAAALIAATYPALRWLRPLGSRLGAGRRWRYGALLLAALLSVPGGKVVESYQRQRLDRDLPARFLEEATAGRGTTVAYAGWNQPYLLFGRRLQNRVAMVPTVGGPEGRFFGWGDDPDLPYGERGSFDRWWKNLRLLAVDYVVLVRSGGEDPEHRWIGKHPARFAILFQDGRTEIWRVRPAADEGTAPALAH